MACCGRSGINDILEAVAQPSFAEVCKRVTSKTNLTSKEVSLLYIRFKRISVGGYLSFEKFREALGMLGMLDDPFLSERIFSAFDWNEDGALDFEEFANSLGIMMRGTDEQKLRFSFRIFTSRVNRAIDSASDRKEASSSNFSKLYSSHSNDQVVNTHALSLAEFVDLMKQIHSTTTSFFGGEKVPLYEKRLEFLFQSLSSRNVDGNLHMTFEDFENAVKSSAEFLGMLGVYPNSYSYPTGVTNISPRSTPLHLPLDDTHSYADPTFRHHKEAARITYEVEEFNKLSSYQQLFRASFDELNLALNTLFTSLRKSKDSTPLVKQLNGSPVGSSEDTKRSGVSPEYIADEEADNRSNAAALYLESRYRNSDEALNFTHQEKEESVHNGVSEHADMFLSPLGGYPSKNQDSVIDFITSMGSNIFKSLGSSEASGKDEAGDAGGSSVGGDELVKKEASEILGNSNGAAHTMDLKVDANAIEQIYRLLNKTKELADLIFHFKDDDSCEHLNDGDASPIIRESSYPLVLEGNVADKLRSGLFPKSQTRIMSDLMFDDGASRGAYNRAQSEKMVNTSATEEAKCARKNSCHSDNLQLACEKKMFANRFKEEMIGKISKKVTRLASKKPFILDRSEHIGWRKTSPGLAVHFGHESWNLVLNMMIGIRLAVGRANYEPKRVIEPYDFAMKEKLSIIPRTRAFVDFSAANIAEAVRFIDYAPMVFRKLREHFGIPTEHYIRSVGPEQLVGNIILGNLSTLSELVSEGKSGAFFYYTSDGRFMIKTIARSMAKFLHEWLPQYYKHCMDYPHTLLTRFYGFHSMRLKRNWKQFSLKSGIEKLYFVVMGNFLHAPVEIHRRYDIKGSTMGRSIPAEKRGEPGITMKDVDALQLCEKITISPESSEQLLTQLKEDCKMLASFNIMDYSLLIGIHDLKAEPTSKTDTLSPIHPDVAPYQDNMGGIPSRSGNKLYYFGIIDVSTRWNATKKAEAIFRSLQLKSPREISCVNPIFYAERLQQFVRNMME